MTPSIHAKAPKIFGLMLVAIASTSAFAADPALDVKGKWVGKTYTIVAGSGGHWPTNKGTFDKRCGFPAARPSKSPLVPPKAST